MAGLHQCPFCRYRFEDEAALRAHLNEGNGCPASDDISMSHRAGMVKR